MRAPRCGRGRNMRRHSFERGDAGADYGTSFYTLFLFGLMICGFMLMLLGFWRATAAAQAERAAYASGTYVQARSIEGFLADGFWMQMTGKTDRETRAIVGNSTVVVTFRRTSSFWSAVTDVFTGNQDVDMEKYLERFRPGGGE